VRPEALPKSCRISNVIQYHQLWALGTKPHHQHTKKSCVVVLFWPVAAIVALLKPS